MVRRASVAAWHSSRDRDLFWPWFDNSAAAALPSGVPASDQKVQQRVIDLFKAKNVHAAFMGEIAHDPVTDRLRQAKAPVQLFATANAPAGKALAGLGTMHTLPENEIGWASIILEALG